MFLPKQPPSQSQTPSQQTGPLSATPVDALPQSTPMEGDAQGADQASEIKKNLQAHLDQLGDQDKSFLAEHLTPEFVRAIGLINGPEVAEYLNQFADPNKVLVPVPRQIAEEYLAKQGQGAPAQPQGQPPMAPPQQGQPMMASQPPAAPMQGGAMMKPM